MAGGFCAAGILAVTALLVACDDQDGLAVAEVIGDAPAIDGHTDQADIDSGQVGLVELIQREWEEHASYKTRD